jgi:hypothetical protein
MHSLTLRFSYTISPFFSLGPFFLKNSEDGGSKLIRNLCTCILIYTTSSLTTLFFNTAVRTANLAEKCDSYCRREQCCAVLSRGTTDSLRFSASRRVLKLPAPKDSPPIMKTEKNKLINMVKYFIVIKTILSLCFQRVGYSE